MRQDIPHPNVEQLERTGEAILKFLEQFNRMPTFVELGDGLGIHPDLAEQWMLWFYGASFSMEAEQSNETERPTGGSG